MVIFFISLNLLAGVANFTGISDSLGIDTQVGGDDINEGVPSSNIATGAPTGSTLFGMYNVLAGQISRLFGTIFPGLAMLRATPIPNWIVGNPVAGSAFAKVGILAPLAVVMLVVDVISFLRGWGL